MHSKLAGPHWWWWWCCSGFPSGAFRQATFPAAQLLGKLYSNAQTKHFFHIFFAVFFNWIRKWQWVSSTFVMHNLFVLDCFSSSSSSLSSAWLSSGSSFFSPTETDFSFLQIFPGQNFHNLLAKLERIVCSGSSVHKLWISHCMDINEWGLQWKSAANA